MDLKMKAQAFEGRKGGRPLQAYVALAEQDEDSKREPWEDGVWLTPSQARVVATQLIKAANQADSLNHKRKAGA